MENGYARVANDLIEAFAKTELSGREFRILMCVIRRTYSYQKAEDWIALPQISEATDILKRHCSTLVKGLVKRSILLESKSGHIRLLSINTSVSEWSENPKKQRVPKNGKGIPKNGNILPKNGNIFPENGNHKRKKERKKISINNSSSELASGHGNQVDRPDAAIQSPNGKKWGSEIDLEMARTMATMVEMVTGDEKQPNLADWSNTIRLMREQDNRTPEQIGALFSWANQDSFWKTNILSPGKLRSKWGQLAAKRNSERNGLDNDNGKRKRGISTEEILNDRFWEQ